MKADPAIVAELMKHTLQNRPDEMAADPDYTRIWGCGCGGWTLQGGTWQHARWAYHVHQAEALEPLIVRRERVAVNPGPAIAALLKAREAGRDESDVQRVYTSDEVLRMINEGEVDLRE